MTTPILSITLPGPRNPDGTESPPLYSNGNGEPAEEAIADFARWCMAQCHDDDGPDVETILRTTHPSVTVEGFQCPGCLGNADNEEWVNRGCAPGEERFRTLRCPCCSDTGSHDTEAEASLHESGGACCTPGAD